MEGGNSAYTAHNPSSNAGTATTPTDSRYPGLLLQPDSRPISQEQLAAEVKSIYAGLSMLEKKCTNVDQTQTSQQISKASEHWQALVALHRALLHEHHDFFLASQHPFVYPTLRKIAAKYSTSAQMWIHGVQAFLTSIRGHASVPYMIAVMYVAFQILAIITEKVPTIKSTRSGYLGHLGRYRMTLDDDYMHHIGGSLDVVQIQRIDQLYPQVTVLAQTNGLQELAHYGGFGAPLQWPLQSARDSIITHLDPILGQTILASPSAEPIDSSFIRAHGLLFEAFSLDDFEDARLQFESQLDNHIGRVTAKWKEQGVYIAATNIAGLFDYGSDSSILRHILKLQSHKPTLSSKYDNIWSEPSNHRVQSNGTQVFEIPSLIEVDGRMTSGNALADYCAKSNFINEKYAREQGLLIDTSSVSTVAIGSGKKVKTTGVVKTIFRFQGELEKSYKMTFHVLPDCIHNLILGKPFLKATRTLSSVTNFARRVTSRLVKVAKRHLLYLGASAPQFSGLVNGQVSNALADSGSNMLIMDEDYARSLGLPISGGKTRLLFADGSASYTSGITRGVKWQFGCGETEEHFLDFHVLKNAPAPVILSDSFLFDSQAYSKYECYLMDEDEDEGVTMEEDDFLFTISYDPTYESNTAIDRSLIANMEYIEASRRSQQEDIIASLHAHERAAAWVVENEQRLRYEQNIDILRRNQPGNAPTPLTPQTASNSSPPAVPAPINGNSSQPFSNPAIVGAGSLPSTQGQNSTESKTKRFLRFKLRRKREQ